MPMKAFMCTVHVVVMPSCAVSMYMKTYSWVCTWRHIREYAHEDIFVSMCIKTCLWVCTWRHIREYLYKDMFVSMYIKTYSWVCTQRHIRILNICISILRFYIFCMHACMRMWMYMHVIFFEGFSVQNTVTFDLVDVGVCRTCNFTRHNLG
jgi:hypothetical protein